MVLWLCAGARGGGRRQEEVRRLRGQGAKFLDCQHRGRRGGAVAARKAHAGAVKVGRKKCGGCQLKLPHF